MYDPDIHSVRSGNYHTLTIGTPVAIGKEPGDYEGLKNKPSINGVELSGSLTWSDLGLGDAATAPLTNEELEAITKN